MSQLREYTIISTGAERSAGIIKSLNVMGNFFQVKAVQDPVAVNNGIYSSDIPVVFSFDDDQGKITRRAGEGGSRLYTRLAINVDVPPTDLTDYRIHVYLGEGTLHTEREKEIVPEYLTTAQLAVPAGSVASITGFNAVSEIRLCIPNTAANGLFFSSTAGAATAGLGAWLEKGVTEWLDYKGDLFFFNNGAASVTITYARIYRQDK